MQKLSKPLVAGICACGLLALVGIALWVVQCQQGLQVTNMRNTDSWGLYITLFMLFVGLSAGGLIVSSAPTALGLKGFSRPVRVVAIWTSICCTVAAIAFVLVDLGNPLRVWELFVYANFSSPLLWDVVVLGTYLALSIVYLVITVRSKEGNESPLLKKGISIAAFACAILVHSVTAWIFGLQVSKEFWNTALLAPWFVSSALVSGLGLVVLVALALRVAGRLSLDEDALGKMAKLLGLFLILDLFFFFCDMLTMAYGNDGAVSVAGLLAAGPLGLFFWGEVIGGIVAAALCLIPALRRPWSVALAAALAVVGVFFKRIQLIEGGFWQGNIANNPAFSQYIGSSQAYPLIDGSGWNALGAGLAYWPSLWEVGIALGVVGLTGAALLVGIAAFARPESIGKRA